MTAVVLSGERGEGRHCVQIRGKQVSLTSGEFEVLAQLVAARKKAGGNMTGFVPADPFDGPISALSIHRLRRRIRGAFDDTEGAEIATMIQRGSVSEYRLAVEPDLIRVEASIGEKTLLAVLGAQLQADLVRIAEAEESRADVVVE